MKKYTLSIFLLIILAGGLFLIFKNGINLEKGAVENKVAGLSIPDKAWNTFQNYIEYARVHDIAGVKSLAYKFDGPCSKIVVDPSMKEKCFKVLDNLYSVSISLKKSDFSNADFDNKQIILSTRTAEKDTGDKIETSRKLIYFIVSTNNEIKLLGLEIRRSFSVEKAGLSKEEVATRLLEMTKDTDNDGIEDEGEICGIGAVKSCKKTDPLKKDTDGDEYWDGIEPLLLQ